MAAQDGEAAQMNPQDLFDLARTAVRRKLGEWSTDPNITDVQFISMASAVQYDLARMKVCVEYFLDSSAHPAEVARWAGAMTDFGYDPNADLPSPDNYWPSGLTRRLADRHT